MSKISLLRQFVSKGWTIANRKLVSSRIGQLNFEQISNLAMRANLNADVIEFSNAKKLLKPDIFESTKQALLKIVGNITKTEDLFDKVAAIGVKNLRKITPTCVSGETFSSKSIEDLVKLKKAGITAIVDFRAEAAESYGKICEELGFKYHQFPLLRRGNLPEQMKGTIKGAGLEQEYVEQLKKFIDLINEGNVYMGCQYGIDRTNLGAVMNYLINPQAVVVPKILTWDGHSHKAIINRTLKIARKIIGKMSPEQRKYIGLPENYNDLFKKRIASLIVNNIH